MKFSQKPRFAVLYTPVAVWDFLVAQPSAIRHSRRQVVDSDAEAAVFAGDRELQAVMRELDAALADMVEELPQQA
jgi:hypothetical protein